MRVTIKNIAQELGISHSTVSRVLNEKQSNLVSEATRERIVEIATRMGYRPSRIAQALQGRGTQLIGVLVPDTDDYFFQDMLRNLRQTLEESEFELMVFTSAPHQTVAKWQRLLQWDLDGVFVFDYTFYVEGLWEALTQHHGVVPPIVGLCSSQSQLKDYVSLDFAPPMEELMRVMLAQGCRRLGYLATETSFTPQEQRYAVFRAFVSRHGLAQTDIGIPPGQRTLMEGSRVALRHWLEAGHDLPDGLFCQNDEIALGAYRALREAGVRVPDEVALAGCDDLPYVQYLEVPLTSLTLPVAEVCRQGWSMLQARMAEPDSPPHRVVLSPSLKVRSSCLRLATVARVPGG